MIPTETLINRLRDYAMSADFSLRRILREAADRLELKRGRWMPHMEEMEDGFGKAHQIQTGVMCSVCGDYSCCGGNFCKNCGAMMDLED